jgi:hypothetical protein
LRKRPRDGCGLIMTRIVYHDNKIDNPLGHHFLEVWRNVRAPLYAGITATIFLPLNTVLFYTRFSCGSKPAVREIISTLL